MRAATAGDSPSGDCRSVCSAYPAEETTNGDVIPKLAVQYIENHDHERFLCNFGLINLDEAGNPLFLEGDRNRWYMLQPYFIALLMSKGIPMLWQGQELAENYFLPDFGAGRVSLLRPLRWDYFYDGAGRSTISLVRKVLVISRRDADLLQTLGPIQSLGLLLFARYEGAQYTLVAVNKTDNEQTVQFWFPASGDYVEEPHGGDLDLRGIPALQEYTLTIPSHDGRIASTLAPALRSAPTSGHPAIPHHL